MTVSDDFKSPLKIVDNAMCYICAKPAHNHWHCRYSILVNTCSFSDIFESLNFTLSESSHSERECVCTGVSQCHQI